MKSWKVGILAFVVGIPIGFFHITRLQKAGLADDIGLWYRAYCALLDTAPYAIGAAAIHLLIQKITDHRSV
jgi:hypothetical protein